MTDNAPAPEAEPPPTEAEPPPVDRKRWRWPLIAGVVAIGLIVIAAVLEANPAIVACQDRKCVTGHLQHALAFLGTVTAALASGVQGKRAKTKSDHHKDESVKEKYDATQKEAHKYEAAHFKKVGFWWYAFLSGAIAAVVAEILDWWPQPVDDWLSKLF
jgi:hypothetical protein